MNNMSDYTGIAYRAFAETKLGETQQNVAM